MFYTHLVTPDHKSIVLPNGTLANGTITNFTKCPTRRLDISVGISYKDDIKRAKEVLINLLKTDPAVLKDEDVMVFVDALGDSSVILILRCWTLQSDYWTAKWRLTEETKYALDKAGINIPYPQIDVHVEQN